METTKTYNIPEENLYRFEQIIDKLQKRARRLNQPEPGFEIVDEKLVNYLNPETKEISYYKVFSVKVFGVSPVIAGWRFYAVITTESVGNVISPLPGISEGDVPTFYRTSGTICQHCNEKRDRKQTYLVHNDERGEFKQVGSTCLHDFTGYVSPEQAAKFAEAIAAASEGLDDCEDFDLEGGAGGYSRYFSPIDFLAFVVASAEKRGFYTRKKADIEGTSSTSEVAAHEITSSAEYRKLYPTDAQALLAKKVWTWAVERYEHEEYRQDDFGWNYYVITQKEVIGHKDFGRTAYLYVAYLQYLEKEALKANCVGGYIGKVGEKVEFTGTVTVSKLISSNYHFSTWLVKFQTETGQIATWFASKEPEFDVKDTVTVKGTVKDHSTYKDEESTVITRCKVQIIKKGQ